MRCALLVAFVAILGCGKPTPVTPPSPPPPDLAAAHREDDAEAAFQLDAACASIEAAQVGAKNITPGADGEAKEALLNVAAMLDSAGASLADHTAAPPPLEAYRKAEPTEERNQAVVDALDALQALRDAQDILEGLTPGAPKAYGLLLTAVRADVDEATDAVENGIKRLGGKVPAEEP